MAKKPTQRSIESTAYHEAGHTVAALALRLAIRHVTITPGDDYLGRMTHFHVSWERQYDFGRDDLERRIMCSLAGPLAEKRHTGRYNHVGAHSDHHNAADSAISFCGDGEEATAYVGWLTVRTKRLLDAHWPAVSAVAARLLESQTISGIEARRVWMEALPEQVIFQCLSRRERQKRVAEKFPELRTLADTPPAKPRRGRREK